MTFPARTADKLRNAELAQIHIAKSQLGMEEDTYRNLLWTIGRVRSSKDLDWAGRKRVLDHMRACGWQPARKRGPTGRALADDAQSRKIRAMWLALADAGVVRNRSEKALLAYVKRQTGIEALEWLKMHEADKVIEALKRWAKREGVLGADGIVEGHVAA